MTKKITLTTLIFALALSVAFCGKKEEPKMDEPAAEVKDTNAAAPSGLAGKVKEYEDFVAKFCALSEKMKDAPVTEKATLTAGFVKDSANLKTLQADLADAKASGDEKGRIDAATARATECAKVAAGSGSTTAPAVPSMPATPSAPKVPSLP